MDDQRGDRCCGDTTAPRGRSRPNRSADAVATAVHQVAADAGVDLDRYDEAFLSRILASRGAAVGVASPAAYLDFLASDPRERNALAEALDVHHSAFFRDPLAFAYLEQQILPERLAACSAEGGRELRVWSAGCAAGQEPYSVAMLLLELTEPPGFPARFRIIATDHAETVLTEVRAGRYDASSVGSVSHRRIDRWFEQRGDDFVVSPSVVGCVDPSCHDLLDPDHPFPTASVFGSFDLVLCCNLLYYYRSKERRRILDRLLASLGPGGYLVLDACEQELAAGRPDLVPAGTVRSVFRSGR